MSGSARLVYATALAGVVELCILRLFTRTAVHIPGLSAIAGPYAAVAAVGRFAYYLAAVLLVLTLLVLVLELAHWRRWSLVLAAASLALFLVAAVIARAGLLEAPGLDLIAAAAVACVAVAAVLDRSRAGIAWRAGLALFATAYLLAATTTTLAVGEFAFVLWCVVTPMAFAARVDRVATLAGAALAVATFAALRAAESTVKVLLLWNVGVAGYLPDWSYALAFGALAMTIVAALRSGRPTLAASLALLVAGGIGLHSTYQTGLVLAGLGVLTLSAARESTVLTSRATRWPPARRSSVVHS